MGHPLAWATPSSRPPGVPELGYSGGSPSFMTLMERDPREPKHVSLAKAIFAAVQKGDQAKYWHLWKALMRHFEQALREKPDEFDSLCATRKHTCDVISEVVVFYTRGEPLPVDHHRREAVCARLRKKLPPTMTSSETMAKAPRKKNKAKKNALLARKRVPRWKMKKLRQRTRRRRRRRRRGRLPATRPGSISDVAKSPQAVADNSSDAMSGAGVSQTPPSSNCVLNESISSGTFTDLADGAGISTLGGSTGGKAAAPAKSTSTGGSNAAGGNGPSGNDNNTNNNDGDDENGDSSAYDSIYTANVKGEGTGGKQSGKSTQMLGLIKNLLMAASESGIGSKAAQGVIKKLADNYRSELENDVRYVNCVKNLAHLAWIQLVSQVFLQEPPVLTRVFLNACMTGKKVGDVLDLTHLFSQLWTHFTLLASDASASGRPPSLPTALADCLVAIKEKLPRNERALVRSHRDGLRQANAQELASSTNTTLAVNLLGNIIPALMVCLYNRLSHEARVFFAANKLLIDAKCRGLVHSKLVRLESSAQSKIRGVRFASETSSIMTKTEISTSIDGVKAFRACQSRGKNEVTLSGKKFVFAIKLEGKNKFYSLDQTDPRVSSLVFALRYLSRLEDVMVIIYPGQKQMATLKNEHKDYRIVDVRTLGPLDYTAHSSRDLTWGSWAAALGEKAEDLFSFAVSINIVPPPSERGLFDDILRAAETIIDDWKKSVVARHPDLDSFEVQNLRNAHNNYQVTLTSLLLSLVARDAAQIAHAALDVVEDSDTGFAALAALAFAAEVASMSPHSNKDEEMIDFIGSQTATPRVGASDCTERALAVPAALSNATASVDLKALGNSISGQVRTLLQGWEAPPSVINTYGRSISKFIMCRVRKARVGPVDGAQFDAVSLIREAVAHCLSRADAEALFSAWSEDFRLFGIAADLELCVPNSNKLLSMSVSDSEVQVELMDDDGQVEPMDVNDNSFLVELFVDGHLCDTWTHVARSDSQCPDLLDELRSHLQKLGIEEDVVKTGKFWSKTPRFLVSRRTIWHSTATMTVEFKRFVAKSLWSGKWSLGPSPASYSAGFVFFAPQALHDLWCRVYLKTSQRHNPDTMVAALGALGTFLHDQLQPSISDAPSGASFAENLRRTAPFRSDRKAAGEHQDAVTQAVVALLTTDQVYLLKKACRTDWSFGGIQTNGYESRFVYRVPTLPGPKANTQKKKDSAETERISVANQPIRDAVTRQGQTPTRLGSFAVDEGMNEASGNFVPTKDAEAIRKARQYVVEHDVTEANLEQHVGGLYSALGLEESNGILHFKDQTSPLSITGKQVESERRTKKFRERTEKALKKSLDALKEPEKSLLELNGGLSGATNWKTVRMADVNEACKSFAAVLFLRIDAYSAPEFRNQRFIARTAVESLAARFFKQIINIARDVSQRERAFSGPTEAMRKKTGMLPGKLNPGSRAFRDAAYVERERAAEDKRREAAREKGKEGEAIAPIQMFEFDICVGNWCGRAPGRGKGNNAFPRKKFMRQVRRLVYRYAVSKRANVTGMIIGFKTISEYRSSVQTPQPLPLVLGQRVNRINPPSALKSDDLRFKDIAKHRPWKLLYCPVTKTICQRDMTGAYAIGLQNEYRLVVKEYNNSNIGPPCAEDILPGYRRG